MWLQRIVGTKEQRKREMYWSRGRERLLEAGMGGGDGGVSGECGSWKGERDAGSEVDALLARARHAGSSRGIRVTRCDADDRLSRKMKHHDAETDV